MSEEKKCIFCQGSIKDRCNIYNGHGPNCFIYMGSDQHSHFECYIKKIIDEHKKEIEDDKQHKR